MSELTEHEFRKNEVETAIYDFIKKKYPIYYPPVFVVDEKAKDINLLADYLLEKFYRIETDRLPAEIHFHLGRAISERNGQYIHLESAITALFHEVKHSFLERVGLETFEQVAKEYQIKKAISEDVVDGNKFDLMGKLNSIAYLIEKDNRTKEKQYNYLNAINNDIAKYFVVSEDGEMTYELTASVAEIENVEEVIVVNKRDKIIAFSA